MKVVRESGGGELEWLILLKECANLIDTLRCRLSAVKETGTLDVEVELLLHCLSATQQLLSCFLPGLYLVKETSNKYHLWNGWG